MNTPAHLIIAASLYAKPDHTRVTIAALLGALVPDLSLYVMAGVALFIMDIPGQVVFGELYFSDTWQMVFAIDNSMLLWGAGFVAALWLRAPIVTAFAGSGWCMYYAIFRCITMMAARIFGRSAIGCFKAPSAIGTQTIGAISWPRLKLC